MKSIATCRYAYVAGILALVFAASLAASTMTLRLPEVQGPSGSTVDVAIDVGGAENVGALQFEVVYDPAVLTAESAKAGALASDSLIEVKTDRPGRLFIALVTTNGINGSGTVATASFRVVGAPGKSTSLEPAAAAAWEGITHREVLITAVAGKLTVTGPAFPWLWVLVALAVLAILLIIIARRRSKSKARA